MEFVKLPFDFAPVLTTYLHLTHPLGIVGGNIPDKASWFPWLAQKYINCYYTTSPKVAFNVYSADYFFLGDHIIEQIEIKGQSDIFYTALDTSQDVFIAFIKSCLSHNLYIHGIFNERYVKAMSSYQKRDYSHDYLIYGFSDKEENFYAAGYTSDKIYQEYTLTYSELYNSIFNHEKPHLSLRLMRFKPKKEYTTNYEVIIRDISHYLSSTAFGSSSFANRIYGIEVWKKLIEYLCTVQEDIDIRFTKIFMEHHKLMNLRLEYFAEKGMIDTQTFKSYLPAKECSEMVYLSSIIYNITHHKETKTDWVSLIQKVIETDVNVLSEVVKKIKNNIVCL